MTNISRWKPKVGQEYWMPDVHHPMNPRIVVWQNDPADNRWFNNGIVCKSKEHATKLAKQLIEVAKAGDHNR